MKLQEYAREEGPLAWLTARTGNEDTARQMITTAIRISTHLGPVPVVTTAAIDGGLVRVAWDEATRTLYEVTPETEDSP